MFLQGPIPYLLYLKRIILLNNVPTTVLQEGFD